MCNRLRRASFVLPRMGKETCAYRKIKPEHIGDAVHPGSDGTEFVPLPRRHVISARPCSTISECACHYSSPCRTAAHGADGVRRTPRYDRGIPCGSSPTMSFRLLYGLLIMGHGRRQLLWFGVTARPTAEWIANQLTEPCGWEQIPRYLIRDRDGAYGEIFIRRVRSIGIRDRPTSPRSPWQNAYRKSAKCHFLILVEQKRKTARRRAL